MTIKARLRRSTPRFNINLDKMLHLAANVFWKNLEGIYLGCNDHMAENAHFSSSQDCVGRNIYDLSKNKKYGDHIERIDRKIIMSKRPNYLIENWASCATESTETSYISLKMPMFDNLGQLAGLFGVAFKIDEHLSRHAKAHADFPFEVDGFKHMTNSLIELYRVENELKNADLTPRESEILFHIVDGKCAKQIAHALNLSIRTVDEHIVNVREKLKCKNKYQLLTKSIHLKTIVKEKSIR